MTDINFTAAQPPIQFLLEEGAITPTRGTPDSAGWDLSVSNNQPPTTLKMGERPIIVDTGVRVAIPDGCVGLVIQRSSLAAKGLFCNLGVIDSDYRGTIKLILWSITANTAVEPGARVAQLVVTPIAQLVVTPIVTSAIGVQSLPPSTRGEGGLGSTG